MVRSCSRQRGLLMLIGSSEVLEGMQICPALLGYPSVPLPVLPNPLIPPDWRRGGGEHSCWSSIPWALSVLEGGEGVGVGGAEGSAVLIRSQSSRSVSCTVHQRRSGSQPESQMTPSTCTALPNQPPTRAPVPPPFILSLHRLQLVFLFSTGVPLQSVRLSLFETSLWLAYVLL